jgi:hypothetical protein
MGSDAIQGHCVLNNLQDSIIADDNYRVRTKIKCMFEDPDTFKKSGVAHRIPAKHATLCRAAQTANNRLSAKGHS